MPSIQSSEQIGTTFWKPSSWVAASERIILIRRHSGLTRQESWVEIEWEIRKMDQVQGQYTCLSTLRVLVTIFGTFLLKAPRWIFPSKGDSVHDKRWNYGTPVLVRKWRSRTPGLLESPNSPLTILRMKLIRINGAGSMRRPGLETVNGSCNLHLSARLYTCPGTEPLIERTISLLSSFSSSSRGEEPLVSTFSSLDASSHQFVPHDGATNSSYAFVKLKAETPSCLLQITC